MYISTPNKCFVNEHKTLSMYYVYVFLIWISPSMKGWILYIF